MRRRSAILPLKCRARTVRGSRWKSWRSAACCRVGRCRTAHNRGGALPGRRAASAAHGSPERSLADLGKNVPKTASVGPPFRHILARKDGGSTRRPPYQRNDYISWIERPKREATRQTHLAQMLDELRAGNRYKGMPWPDTARPKVR
ncbi:YdeI/OmpD-associated family protein [Enorma massiliensis]|uniref:YdeI/OmpD-associated family protein n=1 Tax=Enorma massiliensis TaxID=1472761 RepID=UPI003D18F012